MRFTADDRLTIPEARRRRPGEEAPAGQLARAREVPAAPPELLGDGPGGLPADFERMRWFPLPPVRVEQTQPGAG